MALRQGPSWDSPMIPPRLWSFASSFSAQQGCHLLILTGLTSILNGPAISTVAVNGPFTFLGSRHESEQVSPHPYSNRKLRSYEPSALVM